MSLYIGLMSGTSMDGIDAALLDLAGARPALLATASHPYPEDVARRLRALVESPPADAREAWRLDVSVAEAFADAALALLASSGRDAGAIAAIGSHGQTVYHAPDASPPYTVQLGDPSVIAERTGIVTVADFRRRDVAAGGQGAPLVPAFHAALFDTPGRARAVLNLGGIANVTVLPGGSGRPLLGFDTGPGNTLLDAWIGARRGEAMDRDGAWAASGTVDEPLLAACLADPYFALPPPKSTGREHFHLAWLEARLATLDRAPHEADVQRTLCELTAASAAAALRAHAPDTAEVLLCGGGARNPVLAAAIAHRLADRQADGPAPCAVRSTADEGLDPEWIEAAAFAWLASRTLAGRPGNVPSVTGARHEVVLGGIYPA